MPSIYYITHKQCFTICSFVWAAVQVVVYSEAAWMTADDKRAMDDNWKSLSRHGIFMYICFVWSVSTSLLIIERKEPWRENSKFKIQSRVWKHSLDLVLKSMCCDF